MLNSHLKHWQMLGRYHRFKILEHKNFQRLETCNITAFLLPLLSFNQKKEGATKPTKIPNHENPDQKKLTENNSKPTQLQANLDTTGQNDPNHSTKGIPDGLEVRATVGREVRTSRVVLRKVFMFKRRKQGLFEGIYL